MKLKVFKWFLILIISIFCLALLLTFGTDTDSLDKVTKTVAKGVTGMPSYSEALSSGTESEVSLWVMAAKVVSILLGLFALKLIAKKSPLIRNLIYRSKDDE